MSGIAFSCVQQDKNGARKGWWGLCALWLHRPEPYLWSALKKWQYCHFRLKKITLCCFWSRVLGALNPWFSALFSLEESRFFLSDLDVVRATDTIMFYLDRVNTLLIPFFELGLCSIISTNCSPCCALRTLPLPAFKFHTGLNVGGWVLACRIERRFTFLN